MPILYACVINRSREIVLKGKDKKYKSNFNDIVKSSYLHFEKLARKHMDLDDNLTLHYIDKGSWALVAIAQKPDVTLYEALNFLEKLEETLTDDELGCFSNPNMIQLPDATQRFAKYGKNVSAFIQNWNGNPTNRDKMYLVFKDLMQVKEEMLQNMDLLNDRD